MKRTVTRKMDINRYIEDLREREIWCSKRYTKLCTQYIKMHKALQQVDPTLAKQFKPPCEIW